VNGSLPDLEASDGHARCADLLRLNVFTQQCCAAWAAGKDGIVASSGLLALQSCRRLRSISGRDCVAVVLHVTQTALEASQLRNHQHVAAGLRDGASSLVGTKQTQACVGVFSRRQQARNRPVVGEDRTYSLQVDFLDAVFGTSTEIEVWVWSRCGAIGCICRTLAR